MIKNKKYLPIYKGKIVINIDILFIFEDNSKRTSTVTTNKIDTIQECDILNYTFNLIIYLDLNKYSPEIIKSIIDLSDYKEKV